MNILDMGVRKECQVPAGLGTRRGAGDPGMLGPGVPHELDRMVSWIHLVNWQRLV